MKKLLRNIKFLLIWAVNSLCALRLDTPVSLPATIIILGGWFVLLTYILVL
jgi:hypothetical protein